MKSAFCSVVNSRRLGKESSTALSIDTDFEPAPNVSPKRHSGLLLGFTLWWLDLALRRGIVQFTRLAGAATRTRAETICPRFRDPTKLVRQILLESLGETHLLFAHHRLPHRVDGRSLGPFDSRLPRPHFSIWATSLSVTSGGAIPVLECTALFWPETNLSSTSTQRLLRVIHLCFDFSVLLKRSTMAQFTMGFLHTLISMSSPSTSLRNLTFTNCLYLSVPPVVCRHFWPIWIERPKRQPRPSWSRSAPSRRVWRRYQVGICL